MVETIRDIHCTVSINIETNKRLYQITFNLEDYDIQMTVGELLEKAKAWFDAKVGGF